MSDFKVEVIKDSITAKGRRLTTITATYPRFIHCFDDQTEVLCEVDGVRQFKKWSALPDDAKIAAYDRQGGINFEVPAYRIDQAYAGPMVEMNTHQQISFCVTPEHRMYVGSRKKDGDEWGVVLAKNLINGTQKRFAVSGMVEDGQPVGEAMAELIGFFVGDGTLPRAGRQAVFHLKKKRKVEYLHKLLSLLKIEFQFVEYADGSSNTKFNRLPVFAQCYTYDGIKTIPPVIMNSTPDDMKCFMHGLWSSDGSTDTGHLRTFNTSSPCVANKLSALAAMCGEQINLLEPYNGLYKLTRNIGISGPVLRKDKHPVVEGHYKGRVYCATVSTGLLVVRRNGKVHVSGNCEIMTHRDRARNAASSRAIPWPKMKEMIAISPVIPIAWGAEQSGMQAAGEIPERMRDLAQQLWLDACESALLHADMLANIGQTFVERFPLLAQPGDEAIKIHKSIPNRITEPWMWITVIMTATEWKNFFRLRCHPDAEVHFQKIAGMMRDALDASVPEFRNPDEWHMPFITDDDRAETDDDNTLAQVSAARCARVSYLTHDGKRSIDADLKLFDRLCQGSGFGHWSPHEHVAYASTNSDHRSGPFVGWVQYRKWFTNENLPG